MDNFVIYSKNKKALFAQIKNYPDVDQRQIKKAVRLAELYHAGQKRDEVEPENAGYQIHPIRLANWLIKQKSCDTKLIIAAILHDTLEDTNLSEKKIKKEFGAEILKLVLAVTRSRPDNESEQLKAQNKEKNYKQIFAKEQPVQLLKTADMLDNMRAWQYIPNNHPSQKKFPRWLYEAEKYYIPLAKKISQSATQEMQQIFEKTVKKYLKDFNNYKYNRQ